MLKAPERGDAVRLLQEALASLGYTFPQSCLGGRFDGIYGNETTQRVAQFQRSQGLMVDGAAGTQTLQKLDALLQGKPGSAGQPGQPGQPATGPGGVMQPVGGGAGQRPPAGGAAMGNSEGGPELSPGVYLTLGTPLVCPHQGQVVASAIPGTTFISGSWPAQVRGCSYMATGPMGNPMIEYRCHKVQWLAADYQNMVNGHPPVRRAGAGLCINLLNNPNGPVIVVG